MSHSNDLSRKIRAVREALSVGEIVVITDRRGRRAIVQSFSMFRTRDDAFVDTVYGEISLSFVAIDVFKKVCEAQQFILKEQFKEPAPAKIYKEKLSEVPTV